jgi:ubiquinone/menaquinone biosynthesis C-methylase UbiE
LRRFFVTRWHDHKGLPNSDAFAFDRRAPHYDEGYRGGVHRRIVDTTLDIALTDQRPSSVLDIGCGTGYLVRQVGRRFPDARALVGIDPASSMVRIASSRSRGASNQAFFIAAANDLPFADSTFDLVMSTTSFDYWHDQGEALEECFRIITPNGQLVITDLFSYLLTPTLLINRPHRARTLPKIRKLLTAAGFVNVTWQELTGVASMAHLLLRSVIAVKPAQQVGSAETRN